jgi:hypothetical protein
MYRFDRRRMPREEMYDQQWGECPICTESLEQSPCVPCTHCRNRFHSKCMVKWIAQKQTLENVLATCPMCKHVWSKASAKSLMREDQQRRAQAVRAIDIGFPLTTALLTLPVAAPRIDLGHATQHDALRRSSGAQRSLKVTRTRIS